MRKFTWFTARLTPVALLSFCLLFSAALQTADAEPTVSSCHEYSWWRLTKQTRRISPAAFPRMLEDIQKMQPIEYPYSPPGPGDLRPGDVVLFAAWKNAKGDIAGAAHSGYVNSSGGIDHLRKSSNLKVRKTPFMGEYLHGVGPLDIPVSQLKTGLSRPWDLQSHQLPAGQYPRTLIDRLLKDGTALGVSKSTLLPEIEKKRAKLALGFLAMNDRPADIISAFSGAYKLGNLKAVVYRQTAFSAEKEEKIRKLLEEMREKVKKMEARHGEALRYVYLGQIVAPVTQSALEVLAPPFTKNKRDVIQAPQQFAQFMRMVMRNTGSACSKSGKDSLRDITTKALAASREMLEKSLKALETAKTAADLACNPKSSGQEISDAVAQAKKSRLEAEKALRTLLAAVKKATEKLDGWFEIYRAMGEFQKHVFTAELQLGQPLPEYINATDALHDELEKALKRVRVINTELAKLLKPQIGHKMGAKKAWEERAALFTKAKGIFNPYRDWIRPNKAGDNIYIAAAAAVEPAVKKAAQDCSWSNGKEKEKIEKTVKEVERLKKEVDAQAARAEACQKGITSTTTTTSSTTTSSGIPGSVSTTSTSLTTTTSVSSVSTSSTTSSTLPAMVEVPDLHNLTEKAAKYDINEAGLSLGAIERKHSSVAKGDVLSQSLAPGTKVPRGSFISLVISKGPKKELRTIYVDPPLTTIKVDETAVFRALAIYRNGDEVDITNDPLTAWDPGPNNIFVGREAGKFVIRVTWKGAVGLSSVTVEEKEEERGRGWEDPISSADDVDANVPLADPSEYKWYVVCDPKSGEVTYGKNPNTVRFRIMGGPLPGPRSAKAWLDKNCPGARCTSAGVCGRSARQQGGKWRVLCDKNNYGIYFGKKTDPTRFWVMASGFLGEPDARSWVDKNCPSGMCETGGACAAGPRKGGNWTVVCSKEHGGVGLTKQPDVIRHWFFEGGFRGEKDARLWVTNNCPSWRCDRYGRCMPGARVDRRKPLELPPDFDSMNRPPEPEDDSGYRIGRAIGEALGVIATGIGSEMIRQELEDDEPPDWGREPTPRRDPPPTRPGKGDCSSERATFTKRCDNLAHEAARLNCEKGNRYSGCALDKVGCFFPMWPDRVFNDAACGKPGYKGCATGAFGGYLGCLNGCNSAWRSSQQPLQPCGQKCNKRAADAMKRCN